MRIVDTHAHAGLEKYEPIESLVDQMFRHEVEKAVLVQHMGQYDNRYLIECARRFPGRFCVCVLVDVRQPDAPERLRQWAQNPEVRGIRLRCDDRSPGADPLALWETVDELGLCVSLAGTLQGLAAPETAELAQRFRRLTLVVEHLGHPSRDEVAPYPLYRRVLDLAQYPHVSMKISSLHVPSRTPWPHEDALPYVQMALEAFGPERLMWASDFPPVSGREGYRNTLRFALERFPYRTEEERAWVMGRTALRIWFGEG